MYAVATFIVAALAAGSVHAADQGPLKASFTRYGSHDDGGSSNCNSATAACGFYSSKGYNAAVSQNIFNSGCGKCWKLTPDASDAGAKGIVVKVNNLCPPGQQNNQWCSMTQMGQKNSVGAEVHFDLCNDSGAAQAFFNSPGGTANGTAEPVDCSQWQGGPNVTH